MLHETLREEPFEHPLTVIDHSFEKNSSKSGYVKRCSMCNRLNFKADEGWVTPESVTDSHARTVNVIHTVCRECRDQIWSRPKR